MRGRWRWREGGEGEQGGRRREKRCLFDAGSDGETGGGGGDRIGVTLKSKHVNEYHGSLQDGC